MGTADQLCTTFLTKVPHIPKQTTWQKRGPYQRLYPIMDTKPEHSGYRDAHSMIHTCSVCGGSARSATFANSGSTKAHRYKTGITQTTYKDSPCSEEHVTEKAERCWYPHRGQCIPAWCIFCTVPCFSFINSSSLWTVINWNNNKSQ